MQEESKMGPEKLAVFFAVLCLAGTITSSIADHDVRFTLNSRGSQVPKKEVHGDGRSAPARPRKAVDKPNIVFILTDDQDVTMDAITPMTHTLELLGKHGMTFNNMFTSSPLCCPSRSSILTGNYIHNHGALNNSISGNCSSVAWQQGPEKKTFATYLKSAGYSTFFAGKYLNQYGKSAVGGLAHIPPGWDQWIGLQLNSRYYNYSLSVNGKEEVHGDDYHKDYLTDLINNRSMEYLQKQSGSHPFFMMMSTPACHSPFDSAPQYVSQFTDKKAPRGPSFNVHAADKHWLIRRAQNPMSNSSITYIDETFRKRWRTLLSVDDMVKNVVTLLDSKKLLNKTFIIFSSDNGFHLGQFSLPNDKRQLYDFDIRVPLIVRGPGIPVGSKNSNLVANIDIMPTIVAMATGAAPSDVDGLSLMPLLIPKTSKKKTNQVAWRQEILIEHNGEWNAKGYTGCPHTEFLNTCSPNCVCEDALNNTYTCLRTMSQADDNFVYCNFADTQNTQEFYNMTADPHQLTNIVGKLDPKFLTSQNKELIIMSQCKGPSCRRLVPPPGQKDNTKPDAA